MGSQHITQIVPTLPPAVNGLGDFALALAHKLQADFGLITDFVIGNPQWQGEGELEGFTVKAILERSRAGLVAQLGNDPVLLHYEGYGYAKRGLPWWLWQGLDYWHRRSQCRWVTMFHEIYAYDHGPPWSSSFWLAPGQRYVASRLIRGSDRALTSRNQYARLLRQLRQRHTTPIYTLPVCSNVGEPQSVKPLGDRPSRLIVFGHPNSRRLVYQRDYRALAHACQVLEIRELYDIGVPIGMPLPPLPRVKITMMGVIPAAEISQLMSEAVAGFISFIPPQYLGKSGVYAAYCAHGLLPILAHKGREITDGLYPDLHYWSALTDTRISLPTAQYIADRAHHWYGSHSLSRHSQTAAYLLTR